ncbi:MAG TPA: hypothetical protein VLG66_06540, partial [Alphaproteobacteria bacterium]|nr:hypothetical protein [Alphaproteobacteria bacterium]
VLRALSRQAIIGELLARGAGEVDSRQQGALFLGDALFGRARLRSHRFHDRMRANDRDDDFIERLRSRLLGEATKYRRCD